MRAQSTFVGFIIALLIVALILVPTFLLILDYSKPQAKPFDLASIAKEQINGGSVFIYFNSTPSKSYLIVPKPVNYTKLVGVYSINKGQLLNITSLVQAVKFTPTGVTVVGNLTKPYPLVYNFTLPKRAWNTTLILQLAFYNVTVFATVYPNETAFTS
mgnify:CR=1 FL=1